MSILTFILVVVCAVCAAAQYHPQQYRLAAQPQQYRLAAQPQQYQLSAQPGGQYAQPSAQYALGAQPSAQPLQYRQLTQEEFLAAYAQQQQAAPQVREDQPEPTRYVSVQPTQGNVQPILGSVERQIQKAASHVAGPNYAAAIANAQLADRQQQAQDQVQRNALRVSTAPRAQPLAQYQRALRPTPQQLEEQGEHPEQYNNQYDWNVSQIAEA